MQPRFHPWIGLHMFGAYIVAENGDRLLLSLNSREEDVMPHIEAKFPNLLAHARPVLVMPDAAQTFERSPILQAFTVIAFPGPVKVLMSDKDKAFLEGVYHVTINLDAWAPPARVLN